MKKYYIGKSILFLCLVFCFFGCGNVPNITIDGQGYTANHDEFQGITWYVPGGAITGGNRIYLYFGIWDNANKPPILNFRITYIASDWLFVNKCIFKIDSETFDYKFAEPDREVFSGKTIFEVSDILVSPETFTMLNKIVNGQKVKMRYEGSKGVYDMEIPDKWLSEMKNVLTLFKKKGGVL